MGRTQAVLAFRDSTGGVLEEPQTKKSQCLMHRLVKPAFYLKSRTFKVFNRRVVDVGFCSGPWLIEWLKACADGRETCSPPSLRHRSYVYSCSCCVLASMSVIELKHTSNPAVAMTGKLSRSPERLNPKPDRHSKRQEARNG